MSGETLKVDSVIYPFNLLPPSIFGFQILKIMHSISSDGCGSQSVSPTL